MTDVIRPTFVMPFDDEGAPSLTHLSPHLPSTLLQRKSRLVALNLAATQKLQEITMWPKWRRSMKWFVGHNYFERFVLFLICLNCCFMAAEDSSAGSSRRFLYAEYTFLVLFLIEMILKWVALGFWQNTFSYFRDPWNVMDFLIVAAGVATTLTTLFGNDTASLGLGALRSIRLMRPLRAVSGIPEIKIIVNSLIQSIPELSNVMLLYFFVLTIFAIMFVQTFSGKMVNRCRTSAGAFNFPDQVCSPVDPLLELGSGYYCRWNETCVAYGNPGLGMINYDHLGFAFLVLFQTCTLEGWSDLMYQGMDASTKWHAVMFVVLVVIGSFFIINLTVVIITFSFWKNKEKEEERHALESIKNKKRLSLKYIEPPGGDDVQIEVVAIPPPDDDALPRGPSFDDDGPRTFSPNDASPLEPPMPPPPETEMSPIRLKIRAFYLSDPVEFFVRSMIIGNTTLMSLEHYGQPKELKQAIEIGNIIFTGIFTVELIMKLLAFRWREFVADRFNIFDMFVIFVSWVDIFLLQDVQTGVSVLRAFRLLRIFKLATKFPSLQKWLTVMITSMAGAAWLTVLLFLFIFVFALVGMQFFGGSCRPTPGDDCRSNFDNIGLAVITVFQVITGENWNSVMYQAMVNVSEWSALYFIFLIIVGNYMLLNLFIAMLLTRQDDDDAPVLPVIEVQLAWMQPAAEPVTPKDKFLAACAADASFFVLSATNPVRRGLSSLVSHRYFEAIIILAIMLSSFQLALEDKLRAPDEPFAIFLSTVDLATTIVFITESFLKIVALGFVLHKGAYLRESWNVLDFIIVIATGLAMIIQLEKLMMIKMGRTLRPLRFINKSAGLRVVVDALISSVKPLLSCVIIIMLFWILYSIMGVQFFAGKFQKCSDGVSRNRSACYAAGMTWGNTGPNFDNVAEAMFTLFVVASLEGWVRVMNQGMDAVSPDEAPSANNQPWMAVYFILFVIMGAWFSLNFIAAVLMDNYQMEKHHSMKRIRKDIVIMTEHQKAWLQIQETIIDHWPVMETRVSLGWTRDKIRDIVMARWFDGLTVGIVCLSVVIMASEHHGQPQLWTETVNWLDRVFSLVFILEAILKMLGHGVREYFMDRTNAFDFLIIIVTTTFLILEEGRLLSSNYIAAFRVLRLVRLLRVVKTSKGVRIIINTIVQALPTMANVAGILVLFLYFYSVMAMKLFATSRTHDGNLALTHRANFENLWYSFLMLLRICTGENWDLVMRDTMQQEPACSPIMDECGTPWVTYLYFLSFMLLGKNVVLNVFVAVISESFDATKEEEEAVLTAFEIECFRHEWERIDTFFTGYAPTVYLEPLLCRLDPPLGFPPSAPRKERVEFLFAVRRTLREVHRRNGEELAQGCLYVKDVITEVAHHRVDVDAYGHTLPAEQEAELKKKWAIRLPGTKDDVLLYRDLGPAIAAIRIQTVWRGKVGRKIALQAKEAAFARLEALKPKPVILTVSKYDVADMEDGEMMCPRKEHLE